MSEKLCLRWSEFKENLNSTFGILRNDKEFTDVTLVCEDGQQLEAHKVILAASSPFFEKILQKSKHPHPLIYLRGLRSKDFQSILDFLYFGEANVFQEDLDSFLAIAEEIQLKGLTNKTSCDLAQEQEKTQHLKTIQKDRDLPMKSTTPRQDLKRNSNVASTTSTVVHGNQMYNCPEPGCDVKAKNKDHIKDHYAAIHKNEPRYICSVCGTRYKYRNKWKYCEDKHKGKFLHACLQCDKKFNDKRKYKIHQRVHSGEKPFQCPICSIRMARLDNLNAHTKKTHGVTWREAETMTQSSIDFAPVDTKTPSDTKVGMPLLTVQPVSQV